MRLNSYTLIMPIKKKKKLVRISNVASQSYKINGEIERIGRLPPFLCPRQKRVCV